ncbi:ribonuclease H2, subunit C [Irpex rosettiformis]|uniref:Ribonuclease H2, subunit C n=1 Tax=Irpex rosettiformis TaxID=378272 RepID=A0ACB8UBH5_9APHY|nr:ribonuclease H2, subunit C [Irpex rosettiformis]
MASQVPSLALSLLPSTSNTSRDASVDVPPCTPHLMPFHVAYTGPAPVGTYFRPVTTTGRREGTSVTQNASMDSQSTLIDPSPSSTESQQTLASDVDMLTLSESQTASSLVHSQGQDSKGLTAAFRGRTVRGLQVELPVGYVGLVLTTPSTSSASTTSARPPSTKNTRQSKYFDPSEDADEDQADHEESRPTKLLHPTGTFTNFTLWNADIPVDEGRDEYLRGLREWVGLASVIHSYDEE